MTRNEYESSGRNGIPHTCTSHLSREAPNKQALNQPAQAVARRSAVVLHRMPRGSHSRRSAQVGMAQKVHPVWRPRSERSGFRAECVRETCRVGRNAGTATRRSNGGAPEGGERLGESLGQTRQVRFGLPEFGKPQARSRQAQQMVKKRLAACLVVSAGEYSNFILV